MDTNFTQVMCSRCNRPPPPNTSFKTNQVFTTYICYQDCGNIFWTQNSCPKCEVLNYTKLTSKPKTGQMIRCQKCHYECFYFRCPNKQCKKIMLKQASMYRMGWSTSCDYCQQEFKLIVCECGGEIYKNSTDIIYEGYHEYFCKQCSKNVIYTTCPQCIRPSYYFQTQQIGQKVKCSHCKQMRNFVPCPSCGKSIYCKDFYFGQNQKCQYCTSQFQYIVCPNGCGLNYYYTKGLNTPYRKCQRSCGLNYVLINCNKCKYPLYIENYQFGFWREQQCPSCKEQIKFHLCACGMLNKNSNRCINPVCLIPTKCKNYSKQWKQAQMKKMGNMLKTKSNNNTPQTSDYNQKQCKLCYDMDSCMVNQVCRHMMMCQTCYKIIRQRQGQVSKCPICKRPGRYHKFVEPILQ